MTTDITDPDLTEAKILFDIYINNEAALVPMFAQVLKRGRELTTIECKTENDRLREALKIVTVNLIACHSLLGSGGKRAAASDKMFEIMMSDYAKAIEIGRATAWPEKDK